MLSPIGIQTFLVVSSNLIWPTFFQVEWSTWNRLKRHQTINESVHGLSLLQPRQTYTYLWWPPYKWIESHTRLHSGLDPSLFHRLTCYYRYWGWYSQLDLEALAVDFGLWRFKQYLVGNPAITVFTDHIPLVVVCKNSWHGSVRAERIKLCHQDITYRVRHKSGGSNPAEFYSRHPIPLCDLPAHIKEKTK